MVKMASDKKYSKVLSKLKHEISRKKSMLDSLKQFRTIIKTHQTEGLFDDEDLKWVEDDIEVLSAEISDLQADYQSRKEIYDNSIVRLERILNHRKKIIEDAEESLNIFNHRPHLLKKFSQKHVTLIKTIEQAKNTLQIVARSRSRSGSRSRRSSYN